MILSLRNFPVSSLHYMVLILVLRIIIVTYCDILDRNPKLQLLGRLIAGVQKPTTTTEFHWGNVCGRAPKWFSWVAVKCFQKEKPGSGATGIRSNLSTVWAELDSASASGETAAGQGERRHSVNPQLCQLGHQLCQHSLPGMPQLSVCIEHGVQDQGAPA